MGISPRISDLTQYPTPVTEEVDVGQGQGNAQGTADIETTKEVRREDNIQNVGKPNPSKDVADRVLKSGPSVRSGGIPEGENS